MIAMKTNPTTETAPSKAEQVKGLRERRAATKGPKAAKKAAGAKKAAKAILDLGINPEKVDSARA
jgi:3-oxoacyl-[acyl-carrier-protein] synthase III